MRVLHISTVLQGGGAARVALSLHRWQRGRSLESTLLCGSGSAGEESGVAVLGVERWRHLGNVLLQRITSREGLLNAGVWERAFGRYVEDADVIHLHNAHGYYLPRGALERILERPTVWTLQDEWLLTGRCAFPLDCDGFRRGCRPCPYLDRYPATWFDRAGEEFPRRRELAAAANARFVTPSAMIRDRFIAEGFDARRFDVIPNPLDLTAHASVAARRRARQDLGLPEDRIVLLFVAAETWIPRKGIDVFERSTRRFDDPDRWQLCVVGALDREVRRRFQDHPVSARMVGSVTDREHLSKIYLASDVMVVPSRNESFGLIVIEAAAMGCRVVCSDLPVFREILGDRGTYFPVGDDRECARALQSVGAEGVPGPLLDHARSIRERYSLDRVADRYLAAYRRILGESGHRA